MDFNKLVNDLLAQGEDVDKLAKEFAEALNAASAANKSKKERDEYIAAQRESVLKALSSKQETFFTAAAVAALAAARMYPDMSANDLHAFKVATRNAMETTAGFHNRLASGDDIISALFEALDADKAQANANETDEEKIARFVRALG